MAPATWPRYSVSLRDDGSTRRGVVALEASPKARHFGATRCCVARPQTGPVASRMAKKPPPAARSAFRSGAPLGYLGTERWTPRMRLERATGALPRTPRFERHGSGVQWRRRSRTVGFFFGEGKSRGSSPGCYPPRPRSRGGAPLLAVSHGTRNGNALVMSLGVQRHTRRGPRPACGAAPRSPRTTLANPLVQLTPRPAADEPPSEVSSARSRGAPASDRRFAAASPRACEPHDRIRSRRELRGPLRAAPRRGLLRGVAHRRRTRRTLGAGRNHAPTSPAGPRSSPGRRMHDAGTGSQRGHHRARDRGAVMRPRPSGHGTSWRGARRGCCCGWSAYCCCGWHTARCGARC